MYEHRLRQLRRLTNGGILLGLSLCSASAFADVTSADYGEAGILIDYEDRTLKDGHIKFGPFGDPLSSYLDWKSALKDRWGINYTIEIAPQFQWELGGDARTANNETNFIFQWSPIEPGVERSGNLLVWYQLADTIGDDTTTDFQDELGVTSPLNGGDTHPDRHASRLQHLSWESWFLDRTLRVQFGKLTTRTFLNLNRYAVGDRADFLSPMIVNNPVAPYTARLGLGAFAKYEKENLSVLVMARDANGTSEGLETELSGDWEYAAEVALSSELGGIGSGTHRLTGYYTEAVGEGVARQPEGWNLSLSSDQDIGGRLGAVLRYSYSSEAWRAFKQRLAVAVQIREPLGFAHDRIGFGFWWGETTTDGRSETGVEAFWKLQLSNALEVSAHVQLVPEPAAAASGAFVAGLRTRIVL